MQMRGGREGEGGILHYQARGYSEKFKFTFLIRRRRRRRRFRRLRRHATSTKKQSLKCVFQKKTYLTHFETRAVVVAQLVERLLQIPEVRGSNPVIGNFFIY